MRLSYDPRRNVAYIRFRADPGDVETVRISDEINIDLAPDVRSAGIELLSATNSSAPATRPARRNARGRRAENDGRAHGGLIRCRADHDDAAQGRPQGRPLLLLRGPNFAR
jgi:uncharacterized protein YuzE